MPKPSSPHAHLLQGRARQLADALQGEDLAAQVLPQSLRTYSIKIDLGTAGKLNLYYSPKKRRFRLGGHELQDAALWSRITPLWDGDLGQAPPGGTATSESEDNALAQGAELESPLGKPNPGEGNYSAYVDGSHIKGRIGYGALILQNGAVVWEGCGRVPPEMSGMRQVGGELTAVMEVIHWCQANQGPAIAVHYDYAGIAAWPTGRWQAKLPATQAYRKFIRNCQVAIQWNKVKAHSGDYWNERADELAKAGTAAPQTSHSPRPSALPSVEPPTTSAPEPTADPSQGVDHSQSPRFKFRDLHPGLFLGTASDRYAGWLGQIYPREKYAEELTVRTKSVAGRTYREQILPVKSVREFFAHFRILEIDFTFYQTLLDPKGLPTRAWQVLSRYLDHLGPEDRLLLKVPQIISAREIYRGKSMAPNEGYLNASRFAEQFYAPAVDLCGARLWGFVFEQGYTPKARRQELGEVAADWDAFFSQVPHDLRYHLELRTTPYLSPHLFEVLARYQVGQVLSHWTWLPDLQTQFAKGNGQFHNGARQAVIRLITPRGMRYTDSYHKAQPFDRLVPGMLDDTMLADTADLVRQALDQTYTMALIINNRAGGNAPLIAEALAKRLRVIWDTAE